jgi:lipoate-protein ligase A
VTVLVPDAPAVVLGSTQDLAMVDDGQASRHGLAVVRRRSGGGAVLVGADDPLWVDVDLPVDDPRWVDDVARSFVWLGEAWARVLAVHGLAAEVHTGPFAPGPWGRAVCYAGRGPGEVFVDGAKVVGLAQRRTRTGARFQCAVPRRWDPGPLVDVVVPAADRERARSELSGVARGVEADPAALAAALAAEVLG